MLSHAEEEVKSEEVEPEADAKEEVEEVNEEENETEEEMSHAESEEEPKSEKKEVDDDDSEETLKDVLDTFNEKQLTVMAYLIGEAKKETDNKEGEEKDMKHNVFENEQENNTLTHSAQCDIVEMAKKSNVGSLKNAMEIYAKDNALEHAAIASRFVDADGNDAIDTLFPDYKLLKPGAPDFIERDQGWVGVVMNKASKSPFSRIKTRNADIRAEELRALGYAKGDEKAIGNAITLLSRTFDPQTIYRKDALDRDDIIDITDFNVVDYQYKVMKKNLNEEIATAIMIGDGRLDGDKNKIKEAHVRSIWNDDELYTIHQDVNFEAAKAELQGTDTNVHFGDNYIKAEATITAALYSREKYKGTGTPDFYCTPHFLNVMLLARDLNGRRIYNSVSDLAAALNVGAIYTAEQFEGKVRTAKDGKKKKLLGLFVNLADYQIGCTKGGEITKFSQFDIDFNQEKYLIETRISGALTKPFAAIALEEPVTE